MLRYDEVFEIPAVRIDVEKSYGKARSARIKSRCL
jgi:hypothetical protein